MAKNTKNQTLEVTTLQAVALFEALGFKTARKWDPDRLQAKLAEIDEAPNDLGDEALNELVDKILGADKIVVIAPEAEEPEPEEPEAEEPEAEEAEPEEPEAPKTKKGKGKGKAAPAKTGKTKTPAKKAGTGKPKVGVISTIIDCLKSKPHTKDQLLAVLTKKFPDREPDGMKQTINIQVPSRLKTDKDLKVVRDDKGRYSIKA